MRYSPVVLGALALLVPNIAGADAAAPCVPSLLMQPAPAAWGFGAGRCLSLPANFDSFCSEPVDQFPDARLFTGELVGSTIENLEEIPTELRWLPTGPFDQGLASLCPTTDELPAALFVVVTPPGWDRSEIGLAVAGEPDAGAYIVPLHAGAVPPPQQPGLELRRLRNSEVVGSGSELLGSTIGFAVALEDGADDQSITHILRTDVDGVPFDRPELAGAEPDAWRDALRQGGSETLRASRAALDWSLRPRIEGIFQAHSFDETCWVAVTEAGDTSWSGASEVACADPVEVPDDPGQVECSTTGRVYPGAWALALLAVVAIPRRCRRTLPRT
jgi:MYXO-CTERM domain-containing protein